VRGDPALPLIRRFDYIEIRSHCRWRQPILRSAAERSGPAEETTGDVISHRNAPYRIMCDHPTRVTFVIDRNTAGLAAAGPFWQA